MSAKTNTKTKPNAKAKSKTKSKPKSPMQAQAAFFKRKMIMSRIMGFLCCFIAIASIIVYYLKIIDEWMSVITISYCAATIFVVNSFLQDIKVGNPWQRVNGACAIILYLFTVFLIVYGFVTGGLTTRF